MAIKFSDFTPVNSLETGYEFALLLPGDNGRATVETLNTHIEQQLDDFFVDGLGTTFNGDRYDLGGLIEDEDVIITAENSTGDEATAYLEFLMVGTSSNIRLGAEANIGFVDNVSRLDLTPNLSSLNWNLGSGVTTQKVEVGQNGIILEHDDLLVNHKLEVNDVYVRATLDTSVYTMQNGFAQFESSDGTDAAGLGLTNLEAHLYSQHDDVEMYIGADDITIALRYADTDINSSLLIAEDITIDAEGDIIFPDFTNAVLSANALGVLTPTAITYNVDKFTFSAGENITIDDSSWSAFFGENHIINGIFNDGLVAGEDHFSEGIAGNNAIFGRNNKLTGTGTKNFNIIAGDDNEILGSGILSSNGNAVFGTGNTLHDTSNSSIISGSNITGTDDDTAYGDNLNLAGNLILQGIISASMLGTDSLGNVVDIGGMSLQKVVSGTAYEVLPADKGYILIFTNASPITVTIPDDLPDGIEFGTLRADGAGIVTHVAGGAAVLNTYNGDTTLQEENTASTWISPEPGVFYGFGTFGSGGGSQGLQDVLNQDNVLVDSVSSIVGPDGVNIQFGLSTNGINGIDMYADAIGIASPAMAILNDLSTGTIGLIYDEDTEELDILAGNVTLQALGSGSGLLNIQSGLTDFTGDVTGNSNLISTKFSGVVYRDASTTGNVGAGDDTLKSYALPAGALSVDLKTVCLTAAGTFANTVNNKRIRLKFGSDTIFDSGALAITTASDWVLTSEIIRTGAATQRCITRLTTSSSVLVTTCDYATAAQTLSGAVTISLTGEAAADNDITCEMIIIRHEP